MGQITVRANDGLVERIKAAAGDCGQSMNQWIVRVLDAATDPDLESDEVTRLREKLRRAGLLAEVSRADYRPVDQQRLAEARRAAGQGTPVSQLVIDGRR